MTDDLRQFLRTLTVADLKSVAAKYEIDTTSCRKKSSYIDALAGAGLTQDRVRAVLEGPDAETDVEQVEMRRIARDLKDISERDSTPNDVPSSDEVEVERAIDKALLQRPAFFEIDSSTERAWNRMILGDFAEAIKLNMESRAQVLDRLGTFHMYSAALSMRAAETLLGGMDGFDGKTASDLRTALAEAKKAFVNGSVKRRESTVEEIEALTLKYVDAFAGKSKESEAELRSMLEDYASFGVHVQGSTELLELAVQAKDSFDMEQYAHLMDEAEAQAIRAKEIRVREIEGSFDVVKTTIEVAKEAGVDTKAGEQQLKEAKKAFKESEFRRTADLLASIEQAVDKAHLDRVRSDKEAEANEIAKITSDLLEAEPDLEEAAMYGMDVQEGLLFVRSTKTALQQKDVVTAAKLSRRVRKLAKTVEKDLERARAEKAAGTLMEGAKCGECGKETLYGQEDGSVVCRECGHSFSYSGEERTTASETSSTGTAEMSDAKAENEKSGGKRKRKLFRR